MKQINKHIKPLRSLCERFHVTELYVFGSVANNTSTTDSDIDLLVKFSGVDPMDYFDNYLDFKTAVTNLFSKEVDLVEMQTVKNPILRRSIDRDKILLYGREDSKVAL